MQTAPLEHVGHLHGGCTARAVASVCSPAPSLPYYSTSLSCKCGSRCGCNRSPEGSGNLGERRRRLVSTPDSGKNVPACMPSAGRTRRSRSGRGCAQGARPRPASPPGSRGRDCISAIWVTRKSRRIVENKEAGLGAGPGLRERGVLCAAARGVAGARRSCLPVKAPSLGWLGSARPVLRAPGAGREW